MAQAAPNQEAIPVVNTGASLNSSPVLTVRSKIEGTLMRNGRPLVGARAYSYFAGENELISTAVVQADGSWVIDDLPQTGLYDVQFLGRGASTADWLFDIQAFVAEELDETPPDGTIVSGTIALES